MEKKKQVLVLCFIVLAIYGIRGVVELNNSIYLWITPPESYRALSGKNLHLWYTDGVRSIDEQISSGDVAYGIPRIEPNKISLVFGLVVLSSVLGTYLATSTYIHEKEEP